MKRIMTFAAVSMFAIITLCSWSKTEGKDLEGFDCFAVVAGKNATDDGSVLFAHNEDDGGEQLLNMYVAGGEDGQAKYLWAEFPGLTFADAFLNEYGVAIASDNCPSKEDRKDYVDGGLDYRIRTDVAKYAKSAKDAVRIIGENMKNIGYNASGRSYIVADPKEAWVVSLVRGHHWVAQRVPDDKVMLIPNYYVIGDVDLNDTVNFAGSPDIVEYAVMRGWYNPDKDGKFNFRLAYGDPSKFESKHNTERHQEAIQYITGNCDGFDVYKTEFAYTPAHPLDLMDMSNILSGKTICRKTTVVSTIFQLRDWYKPDQGCVMWVCPGHPTSEIYVPWYLGMEKAPEGWARYTSWKDAEAKHFTEGKDLRKNHPGALYWKFVDRYPGQQKDMKLQIEIFQEQSFLDRRLMLTGNQEKKARRMTDYVTGCYNKVFGITKKKK